MSENIERDDVAPLGVIDVPGLALEHEALPAEEVVAGSPTAGVAELGTLDGLDYGVWEMSEGTATDVEADEVFVVISGEATVTIAPHAAHGGRTLEVRAGSVVHLLAGEETVWEVRSPLRKVYFTPAD